MTEKVIDIDLGAQIMSGDRVAAKELLSVLFKHLPEHRTEIEKSYQAKNFTALTAAVHKLHGAACYCGTPRLKNAAKAYEESIKTNQTQHFDELHQKLMIEIAAVLESDNESIS